jgi:hypothetical protein
MTLETQKFSISNTHTYIYVELIQLNVIKCSKARFHNELVEEFKQNEIQQMSV